MRPARLPRFALLTAAVCLASTTFAHAGTDDPAVRKDLVAAYAQVSNAYQKKDVKALGDLMAPDYKGVNIQKEEANREQSLAAIKSQMASTHDVIWKRTITHLDASGNKAVAQVEGHMTALTKGKDGKEHKLDLHTASEDTWIKLGKTWKVQHTKVKKFQLSVDGKMNPAL